MCLEPVVWTDDGWWRPKNGKKPSLVNDAPNLPYTPYELQRSDDFSSTMLGPQWFFHTTPDASGSSWSLSESPGSLRIKTRDGDANEAGTYQGIPLQRIDLKNFDAETTVSFDPASGREAAGLILHSTLAFNVTFAVTRSDTGKAIELSSFTNGASRTDGAGTTHHIMAVVPVDDTPGKPVHLRVSFDGHENATFSFSLDGCSWQTVGTPISVGLGGQVDLSWRLQAWTGATMGLFAAKRGATADNFADFDAFTVTSRD
jgi:xylan 1,4-beta-xylosidase